MPEPRYSPAYSTGEVIAGRYRLIRRVGTGSSAHVWIAHDERLGRDVALKALTGSSAQGGDERARLRREAHVLASLDHPRITAVYDLIDDTTHSTTTHITDSLPVDARPADSAAAESGAAVSDAFEPAPVLVTELLTGEELDARLRRGPMPLGETIELCAQLADALVAAHCAGVVHRDVKPANVMLTATGAKLLDFGIARVDAEAELTGSIALGTPACMAPEQWRGHGAQPATDVYALGCLLYWCLAGHAPFADREIPALAFAHLDGDPPPLPACGQGPAIDELYRACLAKDPADRPGAAHVVSILRSPGGVSRGEAGPHGTVRSRLTPTRIRTAALATAACAIVASAVALAVAEPSNQPAVPHLSPTSASTADGGQTTANGGGTTPAAGHGVNCGSCPVPQQSTPAPPPGAGHHPTPPGKVKHPHPQPTGHGPGGG